MDRVVVVGGPGSGKSTLARELAHAIGAKHVELDGLWWQQDWAPSDPVVFANAVRSALDDAGRWVADGNYFDEAADLIWDRADTLVWLDLPRPIALRRALTRTVGRLVRREVLWGTNKETLGVLLPSSVRALWKRWPSYSDRIAGLLSDPRPGLTVIRLTTPAQVDRWRAELSAASS